MRINKDKSVGTVIFIVEGLRTEFSLLKKIFGDILEYEYTSQKRGKSGYYKKGNNPLSRIFVFNSSNSYLDSITEKDYLDMLYDKIAEKFAVDIDDAAIFFLFDRDPESNTGDYTQLHKQFCNPWENDETGNGGMLLLSYPSIESYEIECFEENAYLHKFRLGSELKDYINQGPNRKLIQLNKINEDCLKNATTEFLRYLRTSSLKLCVDNTESLNGEVYEKQEAFSKEDNSTYRLVSLLTLALLELQILEIEESDGFQDVYIPATY